MNTSTLQFEVRGVKPGNWQSSLQMRLKYTSVKHEDQKNHQISSHNGRSVTSVPKHFE